MGGASGQTTPECQKYIDDYATELPKARECKGNGGCKTLVPAALAGCGDSCSTYVDDAKKLNELRDHWAKDRCVAPACAAPTTCLPPLGAICTPLVNTCADVL